MNQPAPRAGLQPLAELNQWLPVLLVPKAGDKTVKLPVDHRTGSPMPKDTGGAHNPHYWTSYVRAAALAAAWGPTYTVGFVLTSADPFFVIDIDDALQADDTWSDLARQIVANMPGCMVEVSQSGRGLHVWGCYPNPPPHAKRNIPLKIECYTDKRFVALGTNQTGEIAPVCPNLPALIEQLFPPKEGCGQDLPDDGPDPRWKGPDSDEELIRRAMRSRSHSPEAAFGGGKASFADLWHANVDALARAYPDSGDRPYDASSADAALAQHLAFWAGRWPSRIEGLMRQSHLSRDKWDNRGDYLARTIANACKLQRDVLIDKPLVPAITAAQSDAAWFTGAGISGNRLPADITTVFDTLQSKESGARIALDAFQDQIMLDGGDGKWRAFKDSDYGHLRADFGRRGFKPISAEVMKTAVLMAAEVNQFDSAINWSAQLLWDGVPRVDAMMATHYGAQDTPYTRAVSAYLMTAAAGRLVQPGCQADMALVLVGPQGTGKTSGVRALCPEPAFFAEIDLHKLGRKDEDLARSLRGKLIGEIGELRGMSGRDQESIKAWVSRRNERWIRKYFEFEVDYPRRIVLIGTTNESEFLADATGERRWLPVRVGAVDVPAIERDREQLWAEGLHRFRAGGVAWQAAEELARGEHSQFKLADPWTDIVATWLESPQPPLDTLSTKRPPPNTAPFTLEAVAFGALKMSARDLGKGEQRRMGAILRSLGYHNAQCWIDGKNRKRWVPLSASSL